MTSSKHATESEPEYFVSQYKFTRTFVSRISSLKSDMWTRARHGHQYSTEFTLQEDGSEPIGSQHRAATD